MSGPLELSDIVDLRAYERDREAFRQTVIALKRLRRVGIGPIVSVVFENATTVRFQIQEMARAERMMSDAQIQEELDIYNPLVPGTGELSMTLFIELTSEEELRRWLPALVGIEQSVVLTIGSGPSALTVPCVVDEAHAAQLTRDEITASVHYVRIELDAVARRRFAAEPSVIGIDHPAYSHTTPVSAELRASLVSDWSA